MSQRRTVVMVPPCCSVLAVLFFLMIMMVGTTQALNFKLHGVDYTLRIGPDWETDDNRCKTLSDAAADLTQLATVTNNIRIFSLTDCQAGDIMLEATQQVGLGLWLGLWVGPNGTHFAEEQAALLNLIQTRNVSNVVGLHVSSQAISRGDLTVDQAIALRNDIRADLDANGLTEVPVTIADLLETYQQYPELVTVDTQVVHFNHFPFWEPTVTTINEAATDMLNRVTSLLSNVTDGTRQVVIGETGWADAGVNVNANPANGPSMQKWLRDFVCLAQDQNWAYYWFVAYDSDWQRIQANDLDDVEGHFGLLTEDGTLKPFFQNLDINCTEPAVDLVDPATATFAPRTTPAPSSSSVGPSSSPSSFPSITPTSTEVPSTWPSLEPTEPPSMSQEPSRTPLGSSSSTAPSVAPSTVPSSREPSDVPSSIPSARPSSSSVPTRTMAPSVSPSQTPSVMPSTVPSATPSVVTSSAPTDSRSPSHVPSKSPSAGPTTTHHPSAGPSQPPSPLTFPTAPSEPPTTASPTTTPTTAATPTTEPSSRRPTSLAPTPAPVPTTTTPAPSTALPSSLRPTTAVPSRSPTAAPVAPTVERTVQNLQLTLVGVSTLDTTDIAQFIVTTETWYSSIYGPNNNVRHGRRRRLVDDASSSLASFETEVSFQSQTVTTDNTTIITYDQRLVYPDTTPQLDPLDLILDPFADTTLRLEYFDLLQTSGGAFATLVVTTGAAPDSSLAQIRGGLGTLNNNNNNQNDNDGGPSTAVIAAFGALAGVLLLSVVVVVARRRMGRHTHQRHVPVDKQDHVLYHDHDDDHNDDPVEVPTGARHPQKYSPLVVEIDTEQQSIHTADFDFEKIVSGADEARSIVTADLDSSNILGGEPSRRHSRGSSSNNQDANPWAHLGPDYADSRYIYTVQAPPGKLGVVVDTPDSGPAVVFTVKESSVLQGELQVGDRLLAVDEMDVTALSPVNISRLITTRSREPVRVFTLLQARQNR